VIDRRILGGAVIAAASWAVGYFATLAVGQGMSAVSAYAALVGWWLTAYVSSTLTLPVASVVPLFVACLTLFLVATMCGQSWLYRDASSLAFRDALEIGVLQALAICSPIMFDWLFRQAIRICSKRR
jgi:hypothetical protein